MASGGIEGQKEVLQGQQGSHLSTVLTPLQVEEDVSLEASASMNSRMLVRNTLKHFICHNGLNSLLSQGTEWCHISGFQQE